MLAARGGGQPPAIADRASGRARDRARSAKLGARYLFLGDPDYPPLLAELDDAPPALIAARRFDAAASARWSRWSARATPRRRPAASRGSWRTILAGDGVAVVSGLARGIDTAAHVGALAGGTIAVIAGGIDIAYPPENAALAGTHRDRGPADRRTAAGHRAARAPFPAIATASSPGWRWARSWSRRRRRSGSLITARLAGEAGREVMAVPGIPLDPRAQGCNGLIREGATLVQSAADVLETIRPIDARMVRSPAHRLRRAAARGCERWRTARGRPTLLGPVPVAVDELIRQSGLAPAVVQTVLLELELAGRLERHAGGRVSLQPEPSVERVHCCGPPQLTFRLTLAAGHPAILARTRKDP